MTRPITPWGRGRLIAAAAGVATVAVAVVLGLGLIVADVVRATPRPASTTSVTVLAQDRRDQIAAAPMRSTDPGEALPGQPPAATPAAKFVVPPPTTDGPAGVASGFPATPAGAVGQLAAIGATVLRSMSVDTTAAVHAGWVAPGGPTLEQWRLAVAARSFLAGAGMGPVKDRGTLITAVPVAAQVKGTDGPDWVVACVLFDVTAVVVSDARTGYAVCQRMEWTGNRWLIGPGPQPAQAPSTWPGTLAAIDAGWLTLTGSR